MGVCFSAIISLCLWMGTWLKSWGEKKNSIKFMEKLRVTLSHILVLPNCLVWTQSIFLMSEIIIKYILNMYLDRPLLSCLVSFFFSLCSQSLMNVESSKYVHAWVSYNKWLWPNVQYMCILLSIKIFFFNDEKKSSL